MALFPWTLVSLHSLAGFHDEKSDAENEWPKFIDSYAGSIVVGNTEELYLVRLRPSGKQKKQIRIDTVSLRCSFPVLERTTEQPWAGRSPHHCGGLGSESAHTV